MFKKTLFAGVLAFSLFFAGTASAQTVADIQAQINLIIAQVRELQAQLNAQGGSTSVDTTSGSSAGGSGSGGGSSTSGFCYNWTRSLRIGDNGDGVVQLVIALNKEGLLNFKTNDFDEEVASAVVEFQEKYASEVLAPNGLEHGTGYVGKATRAKLNALYGCANSATQSQNVAPFSAQIVPSVSPTSGQAPLTVTASFDGCYQELDWGDGTRHWYSGYAMQSCGAGIPVSAHPTVTPKHTYVSAGTYKISVTNSQIAPVTITVVSSATQPSITVLSPNGGESLQAGSSQTVRWSSSGVNKVSIWLCQNNVCSRFAEIPATGVVNNSSYTVVIPSSASGSSKIRVASEDNYPTSTLYDDSDSTFTIAAPTTVSGASLSAISPSSGTGGTNVTIYGSNLSGMKSVEFLKYGTGQPSGATLVSSVSDTQVTFTVSGIFVANSDPGTYQICLTNQNFDAFNPVCNSNRIPFTITAPTTTSTPPSITVISPMSKVSWKRNTLGEWKWNTHGAVSGVDIHLVGEGTRKWTFTNNYPNYGSFSWAVGFANTEWNLPNGVPNGDYAIYVCPTGIAYETGTQCGSFRLDVYGDTPTIAIFSPKGGEILKTVEGGTIDVSFSHSSAGEQYKVNLLLAAIVSPIVYNLGTITGGTAGTVETRTFTIPSAVPAGTYTLEVVQLGNQGSCTNTCAIAESKSFTITAPTTSTAQPSITVLSPNGGEQLQVGSTYRIRWSSSGNVNRVEVEAISSPAAESFLSYVSASQGYYDWIVPNTPGSWKIRISNPDNLVAQDQSDSTFTITAPTTTVPQTLMLSVAPSSVNAANASTASVDLLDVDLSINVGSTLVSSISAMDVSPNNKTNLANLWISGSNTAGAKITGATRAIPLSNATYPNAMQYDFVFPNAVTVVSGQTLHLHVMGDVTSNATDYTQFQLGGVGYNDSSLKVSGIGAYGNRITIAAPAPSASVSAALLSTFTDKAGVWDNFGPGAGNANNTTADWNWTLAVTVSDTHPNIASITVKHDNGYEGWSTSDDPAPFGKKPYPLVVLNYAGTQLNSGYNQAIALTQGGGTYVFNLFGQVESTTFSGATVTVKFTDGTSASTHVPASRITPPTSSPTISNISPSQGTANTSVTIYGTNLSGASSVEFYTSSGQLSGSLVPSPVSATNVVFTISGIFAANISPGTYQVGVVTNACAGGCNSNRAGFTLTAPTTIQPSITVLYPNGGETFKQGDQITARWTSSGLDSAESLVISAVSSGGTSWNFTFPSDTTPNDGSQAMGASLPADTYRLKIRNLSGTVSDSSDGTFTVTASTTTVQPSTLSTTTASNDSGQLASALTAAKDILEKILKSLGR